MSYRRAWMGVMGLVACVGEAPQLPEMTGLGSTGMVESTSGTNLGGEVSGGPDASSSDLDSSSSSSTTTTSECGNGDVEPGEECDGIDWQGATCESLGFAGGGLACDTECMFDTSGCYYVCGDGVTDPGEECDGADLSEQTCESLGFSGLGLTCVECQLDASACGPPPGMVEIPGGEFEMGSNVHPSEQPIRQVQMDRFWMDQAEVTVTDYWDCFLGGGCTEPGTDGSCNWMTAGHELHPVNCVDWFQAEAYCAWAEKELPTEAQWEKAARGTDARTYPWGDVPEPSCSHVVMNDPAAGGSGCGSGSTMVGGEKSPEGDSPYGLHDMAGNVWEWVSDWYATGYDPMETNNPTGPAMGTTRVLRGGSWVNGGSDFFRTTRRHNGDPTTVAGYAAGFRCARTPPPAL